MLPGEIRYEIFKKSKPLCNPLNRKCKRYTCIDRYTDAKYAERNKIRPAEMGPVPIEDRSGFCRYVTQDIINAMNKK